MSIEAMTHVLSLSVGNAQAKLVLLARANHAHADGTASWAGNPLVSGYAECDVRTVQRHTAWLLKEGYLREGDQRLVSHIPVNRRPIVYDVAMTESDRLKWRGEAATKAGRRDAAAEQGRLGAEKTNAAWGDRGDRLSPQRPSPSGSGSSSTGATRGPDLGRQPDAPGATNDLFRGDTGVAQTVLEPSLQPTTRTVHNSGVEDVTTDRARAREQPGHSINPDPSPPLTSAEPSAPAPDHDRARSDAIRERALGWQRGGNRRTAGIR